MATSNLILAPGKLYKVICHLIFSENRGGSLELNKIYLFIASREVFSKIDGKLLPHLELHFLYYNKIIKPRLRIESLQKYFVEI